MSMDESFWTSSEAQSVSSACSSSYVSIQPLIVEAQAGEVGTWIFWLLCICRCSSGDVWTNPPSP